MRPAKADANRSLASFRTSAGEGCIDRIEGAPLPLLRVFGWYSSVSLPTFSLATTKGRRLAPLVASRSLRADVGSDISAAAPFAGLRMDFLLEPGEQPEALLAEEAVVHGFAASEPNYGGVAPHYGHLFTTTQVLGRESIYGSGPPTDVSPEFKVFAGLCSGAVLDFGCGNGDLIGFLAEKGLSVRGLELDEARIRDHLRDSVRDKVRLYGGGTPLPFGDAEFDCVVSTEVIEHVPGIADYVPELSRILKPGGRLLVTTPDITSIPSSFPANCVPWHLLEATHLNFFTPASLEALFSSHFELASTYCLGAWRVNGFFVPGSIGAVFVRRDGAIGPAATAG
jgi:SAM-dependent methyltransferase